MKKALVGMENGIRFAVVFAALSLMGNQPAMAANLFWSANGASQGGAGTWTTTATTNFGTAAGGPYDQQWVNANVDSAEFGGTAGQVNLAGPITVNLITVDLLGYNIGNANTAATSNRIDFSGAGAGVNTNYAGGTTTLSANFTGTLTKSGAGRLEMGNGVGNPNTVKYVLTGGALTTAAITRLSASAPISLVQDFITFNGGGWAINNANQDTGPNRGITIKSGGAFFGSSSVTINLTITSPIVGTEGGGLTLTNGGPFAGNTGANNNGYVTLSNTNNSWDGPTTITGSTTSPSFLRLGDSGVIPDTSNLSVLVGDLDLNGFTETVANVLINGSSARVIGAGSLTGTAFDLRASGIITGALAGSGVVATKSTSGVVTLNVANTFDGGFNLNAGTVRVGNAASLGAANSPVTIAGGTLATNAGTGKTLTYAYNVTGNFTLGDATGTAAVTMAGTMNLGSTTRQITVNNTTDTITAVISGASGTTGLTKAGTGTLVLNALNTYTGPTTINAGAISITGTISTIGDGTGALVLNGGNLNSSANRTISTNPVSNPISLLANGAITTSSSATTVNLAFTTSSLSGAAGKVLTFRNDGANDATDLFKPRLSGSGFDFSNAIIIDNGPTGLTELDLANVSGPTQTFSGVISGNGTLNRTTGNVGSGNGGDTILSGNNTYSGGTTLEEGKIGLGSSSTGSSGPIGTGTLTIKQVTTGLYASGGARVVDNAITMNTGTEFTGANDLEMSGAVDLGAGIRTLTVTNSAMTKLSGTIGDGGSGMGGITKAGSGVLAVSGANGYGGGTTVSVGTLLAKNASGSATGIGSVIVGTGATLGGTGTVGDAATGAVNAQSGGIIAPGDVGALGGSTLTTLGDAVLDAGSHLAIDLDGAATDLFAVGGALTLTDAILDISGSPGSGPWIIASYGNGHTGTFASITGGSYSVDYGTGLSGVITLSIGGGDTLPGDFNNDGKVDAGDYATWRKQKDFNPNTAMFHMGNTTTPIGQAQFDLWRQYFGTSAPAQGSSLSSDRSQVPEPSTIALVALACLGLLPSRRRVR